MGSRATPGQGCQQLLKQKCKIFAFVYPLWCYVGGVNPILISQLVDKVEDYSKALIMQKRVSQLQAQVIWLEKTLFLLQGHFMGDEKFQSVVAEMHSLVSECLKAEEAKNEGQVRPKSYN